MTDEVDHQPSARAWVVAPRHEGRRLDVVVAALVEVSRSRAASMIDDGLVTVDEHVRPRSHRPASGERIVVAPAVPAPSTPAPAMPTVVVDDPDFLVLDKPPGLVVHPGHGRPDGTLVDALVAAGIPPVGSDPQRPGIVHRLDKDTSGLLVVARTQLAHQRLSEAMRRHEVERGYLALVQGRLPGRHGHIDVPLGRDQRDRTRFAARADGRRAVTHFVVQSEGQADLATPVVVQLVACRLETGRTHQIRVHMAHAGAPVVADRTYGANERVAEHLRLSRMFLHATNLRLRHPRTGVVVQAHAPLPTELVTALVAAGIDPADADPTAVTWQG